MADIDKVIASIIKLHGDRAMQLSKHAAYLTWLKKQKEAAK